MKKNVPNVPDAEGNTKASASPALYWCFTHNIENQEMDIEQIKLWFVPYYKKLSLICKKFLLSLEIGEEKNRKHLQGYISLKKKLRLTQLKQVINNTTHWEKCKGSELQNEMYILKNPLHTWKYEQPKNEFTESELGILKFDELFEWQKEIINLVESKPDKRVINWYWSCCGGIGKSGLINYCLYHYDCGLIGGSRTDIMCNISGKDGKKEIKKCYFMNLEKNVNVKHISYSALEQIKDGLLISTKYESNYRQIPSPHIIVFSNAEPDYNKLMEDRWNVKRLCYCVENGIVDDLD